MGHREGRLAAEGGRQGGRALDFPGPIHRANEFVRRGDFWKKWQSMEWISSGNNELNAPPLFPAVNRHNFPTLGPLYNFINWRAV